MSDTKLIVVGDKLLRGSPTKLAFTSSSPPSKKCCCCDLDICVTANPTKKLQLIMSGWENYSCNRISPTTCNPFGGSAITGFWGDVLNNTFVSNTFSTISSTTLIADFVFGSTHTYGHSGSPEGFLLRTIVGNGDPAFTTGITDQYLLAMQVGVLCNQGSALCGEAGTCLSPMSFPGGPPPNWYLRLVIESYNRSAGTYGTLSATGHWGLESGSVITYSPWGGPPACSGDAKVVTVDQIYDDDLQYDTAYLNSFSGVPFTRSGIRCEPTDQPCSDPSRFIRMLIHSNLTFSYNVLHV